MVGYCDDDVAVLPGDSCHLGHGGTKGLLLEMLTDSSIEHDIEHRIGERHVADISYYGLNRPPDGLIHVSSRFQGRLVQIQQCDVCRMR